MLHSCITGVSAWMAKSKLKLNPSKTEFLLIGSKSQREKFINLFPLAVLDNEMNPADSARNLGVFLDSGLNFRQHISQVSSSCFYHIRDHKRIRKSLPLALAKQIAVALVTSKLDYCNSLLHEIPAKDLQKLQRVQNCLARVVTKFGARALSVSGPTFWNLLPAHLRVAKNISPFRKLLKTHFFDLAFPP